MGKGGGGGGVLAACFPGSPITFHLLGNFYHPYMGCSIPSGLGLSRGGDLLLVYPRQYRKEKERGILYVYHCVDRKEPIYCQRCLTRSTKITPLVTRVGTLSD